jgi:riboflavin synthase
LTVSDAGPILGDCHVGDSIAVNGACLTVTRFDPQQNGGWFEVWLANETLERTDLGRHGIYLDTQSLTQYWVSGERKVGDQLNLERAMSPHVRFGGHFVQVGNPSSPCRQLTRRFCQGHIDDTATLISRTPDGDSLRLVFQLGEATTTRASLLPYMIPKGYITIDGTSLTLTEVDDDKRTFGIMLIQHTQKKITLSRKEIGSKVNVEVDMVGKYVEKSVKAALSGRGRGQEI